MFSFQPCVEFTAHQQSPRKGLLTRTRAVAAAAATSPAKSSHLADQTSLLVEEEEED